MKTITRFEGLQGIKLIRILMQKLILLEFSHEIQTNLEGEYHSQSEVTCSVLTCIPLTDSLHPLTLSLLVLVCIFSILLTPHNLDYGGGSWAKLEIRRERHFSVFCAQYLISYDKYCSWPDLLKLSTYVIWLWQYGEKQSGGTWEVHTFGRSWSLEL